MKVAIVLLYGIYSKGRDDYAVYLDFVSEEIGNRSFDKVILCGGYTDPNRPGESAAGTAREYLRKLNPSFDNYVMEDRSINTNQNLEYASQEIENSDTVIVYCDLIRQAKVIWIALHHLLSVPMSEILGAFMLFIKSKDVYKNFTYKNITIIGFDFKGKTREEMIGQTYATILDVLSLYSHDVEEADIEQRKLDFNLK